MVQGKLTLTIQRGAPESLEECLEEMKVISGMIDRLQGPNVDDLTPREWDVLNRIKPSRP